VGTTPDVPRLAERLLRHRPVPDVLHVHGGVAVVPEMVRLAGQLRRIPYVAHVHGAVGPSSRAGRLLLPAYQRTLYTRFLRAATLAICVMNMLRDEVIETFGVSAARAVVVPNGVDTDIFHPGEGIGRAATDLLFVGRLGPEKNPLPAVDVMAALPADVTLRIVGTGELAEQVRRRVAAPVRNVRLEGRRSHPELAAYYRRATAVVMPSMHKRLPPVLLEARATGTSVSCAGLPSLIETGRDAVIPVRPATAAGLAAVVQRLMFDPLQRRLSLAARRRAAEYTWSAVAAAVEDLCLRVRAERR